MNNELPLLPDQQFSEEQHAQVRDSLVALVDKTVRQRPRPGRRFVILSSAAALAVVGGGVATAVQVMDAQHPSNTKEARCYSEVSADFGSDFPGTTVGAPLTPHGSGDQMEPTAPLAPIAECEQAWQVGLLTGHAADRTQGNYPVPHLVGCVLPDGTAAVFPGPDELCHRLGLADAIPDN